MLMTMETKGMLKFDVTVERRTRKMLSDEKLMDQLSFIAAAAKRNKTANFTTSIPNKLIRITESGEGDKRAIHYTAVITVVKDRYIDESAVKRKFVKTKMVMNRAANRKGWRLIGEEALIAGVNKGEYIPVNGAGEPTGDPAPSLYVKTPVITTATKLYNTSLPELTDEVIKKYFHRIYDRDSHIRILYDNLKLSVKTNFKTRHHVLLKGKPSVAKTELFLAFTNWLGHDLIESVDSTTMTKAGFERMLLQKAQDNELKPILIIEEIEKCNPDNILALIQIMDARGRIQRVNANTVKSGKTVADCKIVIWGTCNDENALEKIYDGAIWSRFSNKLHCERPDRHLMELILKREVQEIDGKLEWIPVVIKFCYDELANIKQFKNDFDDPRFARALLAGGDRLLDNSNKGYLADFRKVCKVNT